MLKFISRVLNIVALVCFYFSGLSLISELQSWPELLVWLDGIWADAARIARFVGSFVSDLVAVYRAIVWPIFELFPIHLPDDWKDRLILITATAYSVLLMSFGILAAVRIPNATSLSSRYSQLKIVVINTFQRLFPPPVSLLDVWTNRYTVVSVFFFALVVVDLWYWFGLSRAWGFLWKTAIAINIILLVGGSILMFLLSWATKPDPIDGGGST